MLRPCPPRGRARVPGRGAEALDRRIGFVVEDCAEAAVLRWGPVSRARVGFSRGTTCLGEVVRGQGCAGGLVEDVLSNDVVLVHDASGEKFDGEPRARPRARALYMLD